MKKRIPLVIFILLLLGCNSSKRLQLMKSGEVNQKNYTEKIQFEYRAGIPVIQAIVNGHKGWFLFDTGAPNAISEEFAKKLDLKTLASGSVNDSGGYTIHDQSYVSVKDISLGNINFSNTGAIIIDLGSSEIMRCLELDGIIGANLMRKAFWKIDYKNKNIELTDNLKNFNLSNEYKEIEFESSSQGTPLIDIDLDGIKVKNLTFDTGSNGEISIPTSALKLILEKKEVDHIFSFGSGSYGVGGKAKTDTVHYGIIEKIKMGDIALENKVIEFSSHNDNIGNKFFENYNVVLDWENSKIYMLNIEEYEYDFIEDFGFILDMQNTGIYIGSIYSNSDSKEKLQTGDKVLKLNNMDFESINNQSLCEMLREQKWDYNKQETLDIVIKRENTIYEYHLEKNILLPKPQILNSEVSK